MEYKVRVKVLAEVEYEVIVDAVSESKAEDEATKLWRQMSPSDFQVDKGYLTGMECEAEQLTWECEQCGQQLTEEKYRKQDELCIECLARELGGAA